MAYVIICQTLPWPSIFFTLFLCQGDSHAELCLANCLQVRARKYKVHWSLSCNEFCNTVDLDDLHNKKSFNTFGRQVFYKRVHCVPAWRRFPDFHQVYACTYVPLHVLCIRVQNICDAPLCTSTRPRSVGLCAVWIHLFVCWHVSVPCTTCETNTHLELSNK
jgi:hypothetical protein